MGPAPKLVQVTDTVHLVQGEAVNWTLVTDDSGVLLIDAGYPGDREAVLSSLNQLGYGAGEVRAILLTHAHIDHLGTAIWFAGQHGTPVYCHADEVGTPNANTSSRCRSPIWRYACGGRGGRCGSRTWCVAAALFATESRRPSR